MNILFFIQERKIKHSIATVYYYFEEEKRKELFIAVNSNFKSYKNSCRKSTTTQKKKLKMRKLKLQVQITIDGFISGQNGEMVGCVFLGLTT